jgi:hypothetical protein
MSGEVPHFMLRRRNKMGRIFTSSVVAVAVFGLAGQAHAGLYNRGTDTNGNRLIYDSDRNITWYDYTQSTTDSETWGSLLNWASALTVNLGGTVYDDWRLPTIIVTEDPPVHAYNGTTTYGYNITNSEMGHLFYLELGNLAYYAVDGTYPQPGWGLSNTGAFQNLQATFYYSDTTAPGNPWSAVYFNFGVGEQYVGAKLALGGTGISAMAVRNGDVGPVLLGDMNCDGQVDFRDINPFVSILSGAGPCRLANADVNGDDQIDFRDINPFVALLAGG